MISLGALVLVESCGIAECFHVMPVLARLLPAHFVLGLLHVLGIPIRTILVDGRLELADLLAGGIELQLRDTVDVDKVVRLLRRRIEELHFWNLVGFESLLQLLVGEIEPEFRGPNRINRVECRHPVVGFVPALKPFSGINAQ